MRKYVCVTLVLAMVKMSICDNCNVQWIAATLYDRLFPTTVYNPHDRTENQVHDHPCVYRLFKNQLSIRTTFGDGEQTVDLKCDSVPRNTSDNGFGGWTSYYTRLTVELTDITTLPKSVFATWSSVEILEISMNQKLTYIEPGAFENLSNVWNLSISDHPNLGTLHPDTFKGLHNLRGLRYLRNNVKNLASMIAAVRPSVLPFLTVLDFTGNNISRIEKDDFVQMKGTKLNKLIISLTKTEWIHKEAFDPLDKIVNIILSRNILNTSVLVDLLTHKKENDKNLTDIILGENALSVDPKPILEAIADQVRMLDLQNNHFGVLNVGTFPKMLNLKYLDLTNVMIEDLDKGVLGVDNLPNLIHLYLGGNIFSGLKPCMVQETLRRLDVSYNENDLPWSTVFQIDPKVFAKMPYLELLNLSGNKINVLRKETLSNTTSLKILLLKNSNINEIEAGSFQSCEKLFYLDLSTNIFPMVNPFTKDIFKGLSELLALDLSECGISSISNDLFYYMKKLQYISLRTNSIYQMSPDVFLPTPHLRILDLRYNILTAWDGKLFPNNRCLNKTQLDYNHIQSISKDMLDDFMMFQTVSLYANSIICDCSLLQTVRSVLSNETIANGLPFGDDLNMCINKNISLRTFLLTENPEKCINNNWIQVLIITPLSLLVAGIVIYIIYYYYKYDIHFWFLRMKRKLGLLHYIGSKKNQKPDGCKYDAFVSYCIEDEKFVEKMVYILEKDEFNLCIFERDFQVGDVLTDKIVESMTSSRKTILVLTESFAKSQWCCWEMYMAQSRSISLNNSDHNDPLILIKKSDIPDALMTPTLKYLMKTRVYLEWHDSPARQKLFWEQLKNSLRSKHSLEAG